MQDILKESIKNLKVKRVRRTRMMTILLVLSLLVSFNVFWSLRQPGLTLAGDADCGMTEHTHDEGCEENCSIKEHTHTIECYSDETADVESQLDWKKMFEDYPYTGDISKDLVGIAKTQVGYTESKLNFEVDKDGIRHGYTRYGDWYGTPYNDWSATFVAFCLNYAKADVNDYPVNTGANSMLEQWKALGKYEEAGTYRPESGDLVFFDNNTVGIITEVFSTAIYVIRGDIENSVQTGIVSLIDESIVGFGVLRSSSTNNELKKTSKSPLMLMQSTKQAQDTLGNSGTVQNLIDYLNSKEGGSYIFTLLNANDHPVPQDSNGNYIVHAGNTYKITLSASSPEGFRKGTYEYRFPDEVELITIGDGAIVVNGTNTVGSWIIKDDNTLSITFNEKINNLSDVIISTTLGIVYPEELSEINFDGKINVIVEKPREEVEYTDVKKWGIQGVPNNELDPNKNNPDKIYWTIRIEGNQNSNIPGSTITDKTLKHDWSYNHYYTDEDIANGITFGVAIDYPGEESQWHTWTVYKDDPNLIWTENGWEYIMPQAIICDKNANAQHTQVLGNNYYTYYIEYTTTPERIDIAGQLGYANMVEVDNQSGEGWAGFVHSEVKANIYKNGTLVTDASGAKIVWEVKATIPKKDPTAQAPTYKWMVSDTLTVRDKSDNPIYFADNELNISTITANYFGTIINVPEHSVATENDPYAYYTYPWTDGATNGRAIYIFMRCVCNEKGCAHMTNGNCGTWGYWDQYGNYHNTDYCDCWNEIEDTTFTIVYETDVTKEIAQLGSGYSVRNDVGIGDKEYPTLWASSKIPIPGVVKKEGHQPEGTLIKYSISVNEAKLNLTDGAPLVILDKMTNTLAFMRGSLFIKAIDEAGNEIYLQEDVDYTYTYNDSKDMATYPGYHILKVTIKHPQPVTYILDYNTTIIMPKVDNPDDFEAVRYSNDVSISLWGNQLTDEADERLFPYLSIASNAYSVFVHKLSALDGTTPLAGAKFGLFNAQGGLIATAITGTDGRAYFETDVENGIVLREHKIYYIQELQAPPGYKLDNTKYEFCFCNQANGSCSTFEELKNEHNLTRVPFDTVGHIDVKNELLNYDLPATGGIGIYPLILTGVIFIIIPLVYRFVRRRKRERRGVG